METHSTQPNQPKPNLFQRDFKLPPFHKKEMMWFLVLLVFPNLLFWLAAWYTNTARPIINMDYLLVLILLVQPIRFIRWIGILLFVIASFMDSLLLVIQLFPFMDFGAIEYLLPFLWVAPKPYLIAIGLFVVYLLFSPIVLWKLSNKQNWFYAVVLCIALGLVGAVFKDDVKYSRFDGIMGRNNYYVIHTQTQLYQDIMGDSFRLAHHVAPTFKPLTAKQQFATSHLQNPHANKILVIVVESLGHARTDEMQNDLLAQILKRKDKLEVIEHGHLDFSGATVQGEIRELCQMSVTGWALGKASDQSFAKCLPNQLKNQGYHTIALHNANGKLYDRTSWYPKAGFKETLFAENMIDLKHCAAFSGVCDTEITQKIIPEKFKKYQNEKLMFYWMTLTAHQPYKKDDIQPNNRFDCSKYNIKPNGDICRNAKLETQLLDGVANLIDQPEMKGTDVIIVGDHMPPILDGEEIYPYLRWEMVSWIHFKIK